VPSPESAAQAGEQARRVWEAVAALGNEDQEVIYLRYFLEASEEETAAAIGRPIGTVKSRLHRALRRLRGVIEERYPDMAPGAGDLSGGRS
jgi:RNA polymerase sigma-70 factor (ECF subfamily)